MKIMYLCAKHPPFDGRVHYKISNTLSKRGFEIINVHPNIESLLVDNIQLVGYKQKSGIMGRLLSYKNMYKSAKENNPDIIIAPEPDSLVVAYLYKIINKNTLIFDSHEWYNVHFTHVMKIKNKVIGESLNKIITFLINNIVKKTNAVLTVNDSMTDYYLTYNKNTFTIPSLTEQDFNPDMSRHRKNYYYFGQFGNGGHEKVLLDTARILKNKKSTAKIIIIGGYHITDIENTNLIRKIIDKENLSTNIELIDWVEKEKAFDLLNSGLAGIMRFDSQYYKGLPALPNKIFEYMSLGMAIIGSKLNIEISNIVKDENCGVLLKNETATELAEVISIMENDIEKTKEYGANSQNAVTTKYNWNIYGDKLENIIKMIRGDQFNE